MIMNRRTYVTIGGATFAVIMAMSMVFVPAMAAGAYTMVKGFAVTPNPASDSVNYRVATTAPIPMEANDHINGLPLTVLGYGWLDFDTLGPHGTVTGVFATIHPLFTDSPFAAGDQWHAHSGLVQPVEDSGENDILCLVHLDSPEFSLSIAGSSLSQTLASADAKVGPRDVDGATSFTLVMNGECPNLELPYFAIGDDEPGPAILNIEVVAPAP